MFKFSHVAVSIVLVPLLLILYLARRRFQLPLPPGPPGLPLVGNVSQIPAERPWRIFTDWAKKYGDIVHLSVLGQHYIILSSPEALNELLEKRSANYSDRPVMTMAGEMMGYDRSIPLAPYGTHHREIRRLMLSGINPRKAPELNAVQESKVPELLLRILVDPEHFRSHLRWFVAASVFQITHGYHVADLEDPLLKLAEQCNSDFSVATSPGAFLVDSLPMLKYVPSWLPGAGFKKLAKEGRRLSDRLMDEAYDSVKQQVADGTALPSFTAGLIQSKEKRTPEEEYVQRCASTSFYGAASDTTVHALESFFLVMILYPDVQRKAQAEIDSVVGPGRLPKFSDRPCLPYLGAVLKEVHRWNPIGPLALPHKVTSEDVYRGFRIPAGTIIVPNTWAVLHDQERYPDPFDVNPERYMKNENVSNPDPRPFAFGYGRRTCPGQMLAEDSLFIASAMILATFDISKVIGLDGLPVEPKVDYIGIISSPGPFECRIVPRSADAEKLITSVSSGAAFH
ncbi:uncharacterized protein FIBRA_06864 [Fibroporia radiculosa]|uniref:Cytochrome P450 n=1 Tax=Fibroporia radiculosa TaxID=599839 RepID=J4GCQ6_9APHY|nr:uncharacterized protein FIBRA_06864 [Fibroporia radiculosa]CCM04678.1 predicted protein [Fibroporia radiculosa]